MAYIPHTTCVERKPIRMTWLEVIAVWIIQKVAVVGALVTV